MRRIITDLPVRGNVKQIRPTTERGNGMTDETPIDPEKERLNQALAMRAITRREEQVDRLHEQTIQFGHTAIKTSGIVNMAALAAFLGFVSANASRLSGAPAIETCFFWFVLGVVSSALATGGAYLAQYGYTLIANSYETGWERPYVVDTPHALGWLPAIIHGLTALFVAVSYFALFFGAAVFLELVKQ